MDRYVLETKVQIGDNFNNFVSYFYLDFPHENIFHMGLLFQIANSSIVYIGSKQCHIESAIPSIPVKEHIKPVILFIHRCCLNHFNPFQNFFFFFIVTSL